MRTNKTSKNVTKPVINFKVRLMFEAMFRIQSLMVLVLNKYH